MTGNELRTLLSKQIKLFRNFRGWSQAELAEKADISITFLSDIERGNKWPHPDTLTGLARALDMEVYRLFMPEEPAPDEVKDALTHLVNDISATLNQSLERVARLHIEGGGG
jgi:transcriptional regulator with XRE-family HTH domain